MSAAPAPAAHWADGALAAVMERVAATEAAVGTRFPLYADPEDGRWTTTGRGSWTGGFWTGLLWLRARYTEDWADRRTAAAWTARLVPWAEADTATRGLIFWYGTAPAGPDGRAAALRERAARACLAAYDPELGLLPWGGALGGPRLLARADGVPGTVPLLAGAGPRGAAAAAAHLHRHLDLCLGEDEGEVGARGIGGAAGTGGSVGTGGSAGGATGAGGAAGSGTGVPGGVPPARPHPAWSFDATAGWRPCEDPAPGWSRGRAWLLLAVADALLRPGVADVRLRPGPTGGAAARLDAAAGQLLAEAGVLAGRPVQPADSSRPDGPSDTSAAAITAVALLKLARVPGPRAAACAERGEAVLRHLTEAHLTGRGPGRPAGMLLDGCYDAGKGLAVQHELIWGDFFLALGLAALVGAVDLTLV
ncbi:sugar ABC transporter permease [Streptomyces sp. H27-S2]|uniref:sugar ABC transporter permease n=1 Tax=Streptomyces antarcticus TaxID=2996458 RepID=UPI00226E74DA|nr:sugar ABC transporter permease [Streptomyces sp. H27-S2]MCY0950057.1 sugar ABC transporter permease [Streptomyces sp. H27-S2]